MSKKVIKTILLLVIILLIFLVGIFMSYDKNKFKVIKWDNLYNENNLEFFYESSENEKLIALEESFRIKNIIKSEYNEIDKALKVVDILNIIVNKDDVADSKYKNAYDILNEKNGQKKSSEKDMAIIYRDLLHAAGLNARVGIFRGYKGFFKDDKNYYIVEYFDKQVGKWIAIDFQNKGYFINDDIPMSAIEVINYNINDIEYVGNQDIKEIKKIYKEILESYTIYIDNTFKQEQSNTVVTYIKDPTKINLIHNNKYLPSTIYTTNVKLFEKTSINVNEKSDSKGYLVFMKKEVSENEDKNLVANTFIIGGFKDGKIQDEYYLRINGGNIEKVEKYKEIDMIKGINTIELSLDGETIVSTVEIKREE